LFIIGGRKEDVVVCSKWRTLINVNQTVIDFVNKAVARMSRDNGKMTQHKFAAAVNKQYRYYFSVTN